MFDCHRLSERQARAQARAWLEQQHTDAHELLVTLLHYVPEPDRTRALSQLTTAELRYLARLLTDATDLRQVARAIVADLKATCALSRRRRTVHNTTPPPSEASVTIRSARRWSGS